MVKDRLAELKKVSTESGKTRHGQNEVYDHPSPSENTKFLTNDDWMDVDRFLGRVNDATKKIEELESLVVKLKRIHKEVLQSPGAEQSLIRSLNDVNDEFTDLSKKTNSGLTLILQDANQVESSNSVESRIKKNQAFALKKRLADILTEFNTEQVNYRQKCEDGMRTYLKCVDSEMTDEEIEKAIESGKLYSTKSVMLGDREKRMLLLRDVESRHQDIVKLEKSIAELHEMFQDIAMLVDAQGEIMDNIEMNIATATEYTKKANQDVIAAKNAKRRNLKLKIAFCIGLLILIFLLLTVGAGAFCFYLPFICR